MTTAAHILTILFFACAFAMCGVIGRMATEREAWLVKGPVCVNLTVGVTKKISVFSEGAQVMQFGD